MFYPKIETEVKVNEEPKLELDLPFKEDAELDQEIDEVKVVNGDEGGIPHIQEIISDSASGGVKLRVVDIIRAEVNCGVSSADTIDAIYKAHAEMRKRGMTVYPDELEANWNRYVEESAHKEASKITSIPIPEVYQPLSLPDINIVGSSESIDALLVKTLEGAIAVWGRQSDKTKIITEAVSSWYSVDLMGMYGRDYFKPPKAIHDIDEVGVLLNELPDIDFSTLPNLIPGKLTIRNFYLDYQRSAKWYKSANILRVTKSDNRGIQICSKIDKSWERLLVACALVAQQHPIAGRQPTFSMNYGNPTPLGTEILLEACVELTGGPGAICKWLESLPWTLDNDSFNPSALVILLSQYYRIPIRIMEVFLAGMVHYKDIKALAKNPKARNLFNLTGVKDKGLVEIEFDKFKSNNTTTGDSNVS